MITFNTRRVRLEMSVAEINKQYAAREHFDTNAVTLVSQFIDTTTSATFEELYGQLNAEMQEDVRGTAVDCLRAFDAILADSHAKGLYADGWIAFRDWTFRQPWLAEALAQPRPGVISAAELEVLRERYSEQGALLGRLRVECMRAQTDDERNAINQRIVDLEREFAKINFG